MKKRGKKILRQMPLAMMYEPNVKPARCPFCPHVFASRMSWKRHRIKSALEPHYRCMTRFELMQNGWRKIRGVWFLPRLHSGQPMITVDTSIKLLPAPKK